MDTGEDSEVDASEASPTVRTDNEATSRSNTAEKERKTLRDTRLNDFHGSTRRIRDLLVLGCIFFILGAILPIDRMLRHEYASVQYMIGRAATPIGLGLFTITAIWGTLFGARTWSRTRRVPWAVVCMVLFALAMLTEITLILMNP
jgi:hypothetical protein